MIALGIENDSETQYLEISAAKMRTLVILPDLNKRWDMETSQRSQSGHHPLINVHGDFEMQSAKN